MQLKTENTCQMEIKGKSKKKSVDAKVQTEGKYDNLAHKEDRIQNIESRVALSK